MRPLVCFGLLVASGTCATASTLIPGEVNTSDAVVLMGMATAVLLAAIALGIHNLTSAIRQHVAWDGLKDQKPEEERRG